VITEHTVCALPEGNVNYWHYAIKVAYRGDGLWAVLNGGFCLGTDGEWDYEPSPSGRDDDWLATHRFDEATALRLAEEAAPTVEVNGITVAEAMVARSRR
jgi:hypothetical protein